MLAFIQLLKQRYQTLANDNPHQGYDYENCITELTLAEAFLRKGELLRRQQERSHQQNAPHIVVLGPTQAGKSSIVNALLTTNLAGVSALAGYTVHAQGFCHALKMSDCQDVGRYFGKFQQVSPAQLNRERLDCYALSESPSQSPYLPPAVLWDTPDFDSIDAPDYREGMLRTIALADILVVVLSKEKYADAAVWALMRLIEPLGQPTLICLNKLNAGAATAILPSLQEKWQQARSDACAPVLMLDYQKPPRLPAWQSDILKELQRQLCPSLQALHEQAFMQKHWQHWLAPIYAEQRALQDWQSLIDSAIAQALDDYQTNYLNHPHHYETFQHALAQLLLLLEVPHLAHLLTNTRQVLTWPIRQLMQMGKKQASRPDKSQELFILNQLAAQCVLRLADNLLHNAEQSTLTHWWKELSHVLRSQRTPLLTNFNQATQKYHIDFQQDVEYTAKQLYNKLQEQPLVLNSLRATRVTTDAAVIAMTLYTGGIGLHDLVIAPAMLTVTSLLTESAVGGYMHKLETDLKHRQLMTVKQQLFTAQLKQTLLALPAQLNPKQHFAISCQQTDKASNELAHYNTIEKRHGLRILTS